MAKRRSFSRKKPERDQRKIFLILAEGRKTEQNYFNILKKMNNEVNIRVIPRTSKSAPEKVLDDAKKITSRGKQRSSYYVDIEPKRGDEVWLVVDYDSWGETKLSLIYSLCQQEKYNFSLTYPKFEYWLLLHFESGSGISSANDCEYKLRKHLPLYDKGVLEQHISIDSIKTAIVHARAKDVPPCATYPTSNGSTVYRLVEKLLPQNDNPCG